MGGSGGSTSSTEVMNGVTKANSFQADMILIPLMYSNLVRLDPNIKFQPTISTA